MDKILQINIDKSKSIPLYVQVADGIKGLIASGVYLVEDKLPPIRLLAEALNVNNDTIVKAYQMLSDEKVTYKVRGSGSYIAPKKEELLAQIAEYDNAETQNFLINNNQFEVGVNAINFATATPKANLFPVTDFKKAINQVLDRDLGEAFSYQEAKGYYPLRESICDYLKTFQIKSRPEEVLIISGAQQGLDIVSKALLNYNDVVLVEAPTYSGAIASFRSRGVKIIQIPMLVDGVNTKKLEEIIKRYQPKLMFTMTHCQNPTGYSYSQKKKEALLSFANKYNMLIIEDDYVGELIYSKNIAMPIKSMAGHDKVIYIKSFSKILMPGLRLGFMVVPNNLMETISNAKQATDISTSGLIQKAFDVYLRNGQWFKQLSQMKKVYYKRFQLMVGLLDKHLPRKVTYYVPKGGIMFWIELPKGMDARDFYNHVSHEKLAFVPGDLFYYNQQKSNAFRLSIAAVGEKEIEHGIVLLCDLLTQYINDTPKNTLPIL